MPAKRRGKARSGHHFAAREAITMCKLISPLLCGLCLFSALPVLTQAAPVYDLSTLEEGATFDCETSNGSLSTTYQGYFGEAYVFSSTELQNRNVVSEGQMGVSKTGQMLWTERVVADGVISYFASPNDCSFVLGICQAELVFGTRVLASITVQTTYKNQVWTHIETTLTPSGTSEIVYFCGVYDEFSMVIALVMKNEAGGSYWQRVISGPDAQVSAAALNKAKLACQRFPSNA